eukprot:SAG22_NODE_495_length_9802_cov_111.077605_4_plen_255_part_00
MHPYRTGRPRVDMTLLGVGKLDRFSSNKFLLRNLTSPGGHITKPIASSIDPKNPKITGPCGDQARGRSPREGWEGNFVCQALFAIALSSSQFHRAVQLGATAGRSARPSGPRPPLATVGRGRDRGASAPKRRPNARRGPRGCRALHDVALRSFDSCEAQTRSGRHQRGPARWAPIGGGGDRNLRGMDKSVRRRRRGALAAWRGRPEMIVDGSNIFPLSKGSHHCRIPLVLLNIWILLAKWILTIQEAVRLLTST